MYFIHPYLYLDSYAEVFGRRIVEHTEAPRLDDMLGMRFGDLMNDVAFADCFDTPMWRNTAHHIARHRHDFLTLETEI